MKTELLILTFIGLVATQIATADNNYFGQAAFKDSSKPIPLLKGESKEFEKFLERWRSDTRPFEFEWTFQEINRVLDARKFDRRWKSQASKLTKSQIAVADKLKKELVKMARTKKLSYGQMLMAKNLNKILADFLKKMKAFKEMQKKN